MYLRGIFISTVLLLFTFNSSFAQTHTAINVSMTSNSTGYYEYLPQGYNSGSQYYPLILFVHGAGELGSHPLSVLTASGLPHLIEVDSFPASFTVNGQTSSFIVISPKFQNWPAPLDIQEILNYVVQHYRINENRIYMTGLSMGGGVTWDYASDNSIYANRLAAILPIAGASAPDLPRSKVIAQANLPVWATHNNADQVVTVSYTNNWITDINSVPAPTPAAKKTIFFTVVPGDNHDAWTQTYDPTWTDGIIGGPNVYEWMLQYHRSIVLLPVTLTSYSVSIPLPNEIRISWTTTQEQNNAYFMIERSTDGINFASLGRVNSNNLVTGSNYVFNDNNPVKGTSYYRLSETDIFGKTTYFQIKKVSLNALSQNILQVYPNPVHDNLTLEMNNPSTGKIKITVINGAGKMIKTTDFNKVSNYQQETIQVNDLPAGYYIIKIDGADYSSSLSFVKE